MIILPFHSFTEILSTELQVNTLKVISAHLQQQGLFILTLQNPTVRVKSVDGITRKVGELLID